ncbi:hypothetical protein F1880_004007 [Penicillium rolfsii]|nr:hypothetical protein F1880_004007 [Penicillium rolfsii]
MDDVKMHLTGPWVAKFLGLFCLGEGLGPPVARADHQLFALVRRGFALHGYCSPYMHQGVFVGDSDSRLTTLSAAAGGELSDLISDDDIAERIQGTLLLNHPISTRSAVAD